MRVSLMPGAGRGAGRSLRAAVLASIFVVVAVGALAWSAGLAAGREAVGSLELDLAAERQLSSHWMSVAVRADERASQAERSQWRSAAECHLEVAECAAQVRAMREAWRECTGDTELVP